MSSPSLEHRADPVSASPQSPDAERVGPATATDAARSAIRLLAERRLSPTPANYARAWIEVGGPTCGSGRVGGVPDTADVNRSALQRQVVGARKTEAELVEIVAALCAAVESLADDRSRIASLAAAVREAVRDRVDRRSLAAVRSMLQEAVVGQLSIARSRRDADASLRDALPRLVRRMSRLGTDTSDFGDSLSGHLQAISAADSREDVVDRVRGLLAEAQSMHRNVDDARRDLGARAERIQALESEVQRLERELAQASDRLLTDHLTRASNRAGLARAFERALTSLRAGDGPLAIALLDIDDFKNVNDALGHGAGDGALRHLAGLLRDRLSPDDTVARYGGEEFAILLPGLTDVQARESLVRIQRELTREVYLHESRHVFITFSAGTTRVDPRDTLETAIDRADEAMYRAKHAGKNCVAIA